MRAIGCTYFIQHQLQILDTPTPPTTRRKTTYSFGLIVNNEDDGQEEQIDGNEHKLRELDIRSTAR